MKTFDRIVIIFNPQSAGDSPKIAAQLADQLSDIKIAPVKLVETEYAGHAVELATKYARSGKPLIVSVSGDGGYNEVINGVMQADNPEATTAVLAAGNANDHARVMQDKPLLELIKIGTKRHIDLLQMTAVFDDGSHQSRYAHSYIGFGLTPTVALELEKNGKGSISKISTALKSFKDFKPFELTYQSDEVVEIDSLIFANISQMAKVATLHDQDSPADGLFEVISMPHMSKVRTVYYAAKAAVTGLGSQPSVSNYKFDTREGLPVQLDGELWELPAAAHIVIRSQKRALLTIVDV